MAKYSYLLPTKQYKNIGPYRLLQLSGLKRGEVVELSQIQRRSARQMVSGLNLANKISKTKGITVEEALDALQNLGTPESAPLMAEFASDLAEMMAQEKTAEELEAELITVFMRSRVEAQLDGETWTRLQDWSDEDTAELPEHLVREVVTFIEKERGAGTEDEELPGNSPDAPKSRKTPSPSSTN